MAAFVDGYNAFAKSTGVNLAAFGGAEYVDNVETAIMELAGAINNPGRKIDKASLDSVKGFMTEKWHADTLNIAAALKNSNARATAIDDNGIVDIATNFGHDYQSKVNANPNDSISQLGITNEGHFLKNHRSSEYTGDNPGGLYYDGQFGLVPSDNLEEIKRLLQLRILKNSETRPEVSSNYQQLLDNLTDRVKSPDGTQSIPLSEAEARQLAQLAKDENFDPAKWGISTEELISAEYIFAQAFKAGLSAAIISVVLEVAPEIVAAISNLIRNGEVNADDFKRIGFAAVKGGGLGFICGTVASALTIACKAGKLGESLKSANPSIVGAVVALTMSVMQDATLMAFGKMTKREFTGKRVEELFVTGCSLGLGFTFEAVFTATPIKCLPFLLGSFIGSVVGSFVYKTGYSCVMSYCIDSGFTFFGLVEQDYTLPDEVLEEIGVDVFEYEKLEPKRIEQRKFEPKRFSPKELTAQNIDIHFLRRGVIGVNCVGYL